MGLINQNPELFAYFKEIKDRLERLERGTRFSIPLVATDPASPVKGDIWINSTSNTLKVIDKNGTLRTITMV